jgi:hypothetical protein
MKEVHMSIAEAKQQKNGFNTANRAGGSRQAEQESQTQRPEMPPVSQKEMKERRSANRQPDITEESTHTGDRFKNDKRQQKDSRKVEDDEIFNSVFGGETEEQINAHNERVSADREKERLKKEKQREEIRNLYEKHQARLAAMSPEEREAWERRKEKIRTPLKPLSTEELTQLLYKWHENVLASRREKAAWLHERDPRYDPMTGDLLEPDEHPLSPTSEYYFDGETRPRRFVPGDSPHLKNRKQLDKDEADIQPEGEKNQRFVDRLMKAGFVEVEPTLADKASFERAQWYRSLSASEKMQYLRESMQEMTRRGQFDRGNTGEKVARFIEFFIDFLLALFAPEMKKADRDDSAGIAA